MSGTDQKFAKEHNQTPLKRSSNFQSMYENIGFTMLRASTIIILVILSYILFEIISKGIGIVSLKFLTADPSKGMTEGGIYPAIIGTVYLSILTALFSVPLGVCAAIYLQEYARKGSFTRIIKMSIRNLAGVPSIVFGLFGVALFVRLFGFGPSLLAASLTLSLLILPWIISATEEALKAVPMSYREGAFALGATRWQIIRTIVVPQAFPGILTGTILGISRAAGETAPILFTGAAFLLVNLPDSAFDQFMALPYHLFILATQHHSIAAVRPIAYGTAFVLIIVVFGLNLTAIVMRSYFRRKAAD